MLKISLLSALLLLSSISSAAEDCSAAQIGATYRATEKRNNSEHSYILELWRKGKQAIHSYPESHISELWQLAANGRIGSVRYFDEHQRGIEYQPGEKLNEKENRDWSIKSQLVSDSLLQQMELLEKSGEGCERTETYIQNNAGQFMQISWLPEKKLVKEFSHISAGKSIHWVLQSTVEDAEKIAIQMGLRDHYQMTDFADIGDNESDPFLLGMINLGFIEHGTSGFYNAEGDDIGEGRHH